MLKMYHQVYKYLHDTYITYVRIFKTVFFSGIYPDGQMPTDDSVGKVLNFSL